MNVDIINWILRTATNTYESSENVTYGKCVFEAACRIMDISYLAGTDIDPSNDDLKVKDFLFTIMYLDEHGEDHNGKPPLKDDDTIESPHRPPHHGGHHHHHPSDPNRPGPRPERPDKPSEKPDFKPDYKPDEKPDEKPSEQPDTKPEEKPEENPDEPITPPIENPDGTTGDNGETGNIETPDTGNEDNENDKPSEPEQPEPDYSDSSSEGEPDYDPDYPDNESSCDDSSCEWDTESRLEWLRKKRLHLEEKIRTLEKAEKERTYKIQMGYFAKTIYDSTKDTLVRNGVIEDDYKDELENLGKVVRGDKSLLSEANLYKGKVIAVRKYSENDYSIYLKFYSLETYDDQVLMTRYRNDVLFPKE